MRLLWLLFISLSGLAFAQREALRIGDGVSSPKLLRKVEPSYSSHAIGARVQGSVVLGLVIDENGEFGDIENHQSVGFWPGGTGYSMCQKVEVCTRHEGW